MLSPASGRGLQLAVRLSLHVLLATAALVLALGPSCPGAARAADELGTPSQPHPSADRLRPALPETDAQGRVQGLPRFWIRGIEIVGNTVLSDGALEQLAQAYVDREVDALDLAELQGALTQLYRDAGYISTRALLPDQDLAGGRLRIRILEGRLGAVRVSGNRGFRSAYLEQRVAPKTGEVLNIHTLEARLQRLRRDSRIGALHAVLQPGFAPGESILAIEVREANRYAARAASDNFQSPAIGSVNGNVELSFANALGWGDGLSARSAFSHGLSDIHVGYGLPFTRYDTRLDLSFRYNAIEIVEGGRDGVEVESDYFGASIALRQPVYHGRNILLEVGVMGEWRQIETKLDGFPFALSDPSGDARTRVAVIRVMQSGVYQARDQVIAARSTFSFGLDALGATSSVIEPADFISWLGQLHVLHRFPSSGIELFGRADAQLAVDPLLPFERFSVGGRYSVRGYRRNQFLRANGIAVGFEFRYPLLRSPSGATSLHVVPFTDYGRSWDRVTGGATDHLVSVGLGLVWKPRSWFQAELFYGAAMRALPDAPNKDLQDHGVTFEISVATF